MNVLIIAREQAVINSILPLIRGGGFEAVGTPIDDEAVAQLESGNIGAVVIGGGVQEESRRRIRSVADPKHIAVIDGALGGKDIETYVQQELLPALRRVKNAQTNHLTSRAPEGALKPITAENSVLVMVDYSTKLVESVKSQPKELLINNATALAKTGAMFNIPTFILGEEGERYGVFEPSIHGSLRDGIKVPRHTVSAWDEPAFVEHIEKSGRTNLIVAGISTDLCVGLLARDVRRAGYDVTVVVDASGSQSSEMHRIGVDRMIQAGCIPTTWVALTAELLSDFHRNPEAQEATKIISDHLFAM